MWLGKDFAFLLSLTVIFIAIDSLIIVVIREVFDGED